MATYILHSTKFEGSLTYRFDENERLIGFDIAGYIPEPTRRSIFQTMPLTIAELKLLTSNSSTVTIEEIPENISFDAFWELYKKKINRKRCEPLWNKLSDANKLEVLRNVPHYLNFLKRVSWRTQADPDTYLRQEYFKTDWKNEHS